MINILYLTGELYLTLEVDNTVMNYNEIKTLFTSHIKLESYYMIVNNNENIYTNLYDIYEVKYRKNIVLNNELNIIILPYTYEEVNKIKNYKPSYILIHWFVDNFPNDILKNDKLFALMTLNSHSMNYKLLSDSLKEDPQIIKNAVFSNGVPNYECLAYIPKKCKEDKKFIEFFINCNGKNIKFASPELKKDLELTHLALNNNIFAIEFIDQAYRDNEELMLKILNKNIICFEYISERLRYDKKIIMKCLNQLLINLNFNQILQFTSDTNRNDKEIVLPLISINGDDLQYVSNELRRDREIVFTAVKNCPSAYVYADELFFDDKEFLLLSLAGEHYDEENYIDFLENLSNTLQDDKDIVLAAVKKCGTNIKFASERLRNDKDVVMEALKNCYYEQDKFMKNDEILRFKKKINKNIDIILKDTNLKNDSDVLQQVIKKIKLV